MGRSPMMKPTPVLLASEGRAFATVSSGFLPSGVGFIIAVPMATMSRFPAALSIVMSGVGGLRKEN